MQALYALKQSATANYYNAIASAEEVFTPDLNSMEIPDLKLLEQKKQRAAALFENHFKTPSETTSEEADITKAVSDALIQFRNQVDKDKKHFSKVVDEVRQFQKSVCVSCKMGFDQVSLQVATDCAHSNQSCLCTSS